MLIPGPSDPGVGNVLPRAGLMPMLTQRMKDKIRKVWFPSNPCRILYYTRQIVVFRDDLLQKMRRNCILEPNKKESENMSEHLVKTVLFGSTAEW